MSSTDKANLTDYKAEVNNLVETGVISEQTAKIHLNEVRVNVDASTETLKEVKKLNSNSKKYIYLGIIGVLAITAFAFFQ